MKTHNLAPAAHRQGKRRRKAAKPAPVELPETFSIGWPPGFVPACITKDTSHHSRSARQLRESKKGHADPKFALGDVEKA